MTGVVRGLPIGIGLWVLLWLWPLPTLAVLLAGVLVFAWLDQQDKGNAR